MSEKKGHRLAKPTCVSALRVDRTANIMTPYFEKGFIDRLFSGRIVESEGRIKCTPYRFLSPLYLDAWNRLQDTSLNRLVNPSLTIKITEKPIQILCVPESSEFLQNN